MTARWPPRVLAAGAGALALALLALLVDYAVTAGRLPDVPPSAIGRPPELVERVELRDGYAARARLYLALLTVALAAVIGRGLTAPPAALRRDRFTDVGVLGVLSGLVVAFTLTRSLDLLDDQNFGVAWALPAGLLAAAAIGTLASPRAERRPAPPVARVALGLVALSVALVIAGLAGRDCGAASGGQDLVLWLAILTSAAAALVGLAALAKRRWVVALISLPTPVVVVIGALLAALCES